LDTGRPLRERTVWVRRRGVSRTFRERAQNLGYGRDLYTLTGGVGGRDLDPGMVDRAWGAYEANLPVAIPALADHAAHPVAARLWIGGLVPFVAGLFVRGPEFNWRFEVRPPLSSLKDYYGPAGFADNTNLA